MPVVLRGSFASVAMDRCSWNDEWQNVGGIYAFADDHGVQLRILFIGETADFSATMRRHPLWARATALGANSVYAAPMEGNRSRVVDDLVARFRPELQAYESDAARSNAAERTGSETGIHEILDAMTEKVVKDVPASGIHDILDEMFQQTNRPTPKPGTVATRFGAQDQDPSKRAGAEDPRFSRPSLATGILSKFGFNRS